MGEHTKSEQEWQKQRHRCKRKRHAVPGNKPPLRQRDTNAHTQGHKQVQSACPQDRET